MATNERSPFKEGRFSEELEKLLESVALGFGDDLDFNNMEIKHLSEAAFTNAVYKVSWATKSEDVVRNVLVRIYGGRLEFFIDRDEEIHTFQWISNHGDGPRLFGKFENGRVEEFIHGRTLSASDLRDEEISNMIAAKLKEFHNLDKPGPKKVVLWDKIRFWISKAKSLCTLETQREFRIDELEEEINTLEKELSKNSPEIVFCHNDLQYGNILLNEDTKKLTFIDYEYSGYNPLPYDLANHFCEITANYHSETPHLMDGNLYPGVEERHRFIRTYLGSTGVEPTEAQVQKLADDAEKYTLANHLFWGLWAILSDAYVNQVEFDYLGYAKQRCDNYWLRKSQLFGTAEKSIPNNNFIENEDREMVIGASEFNTQPMAV